MATTEEIQNKTLRWFVFSNVMTCEIWPNARTYKFSTIRNNSNGRSDYSFLVNFYWITPKSYAMLSKLGYVYFFFLFYLVFYKIWLFFFRQFLLNHTRVKYDVIKIRVTFTVFYIIIYCIIIIVKPGKHLPPGLLPAYYYNNNLLHFFLKEINKK